MKNIFFPLLFFLFSCFIKVNGQKLSDSASFSLPKFIHEGSGIISWKENFIIHNDSGNEPELFVISKTGKLISHFIFPQLRNTDWEDICKDDQQNIYVGDFGNNLNKRKSLIIYKINFSDSLLKSEEIKFSFTEQHAFPPAEKDKNFDVEACIWKNNFIYIFTKNNTKPYNGIVNCYKIPDQAGNYQAVLIDSFCLGKNGYFSHSVTAADYNEKTNQLLLMTYQHLFIFSGFSDDHFFSGQFAIFDFGMLTQKEGICFTGTHSFAVIDEKRMAIGGNLIYYSVEDYFNGKSVFSRYLSKTPQITGDKEKKVTFELQHNLTAGTIILALNDGKKTIKKDIHEKSNGKQFIFPLPESNKKTQQQLFLHIFLNNELIYLAPLNKIKQQ